MTFDELHEAVERLQDKAGDYISLGEDVDRKRIALVIDSIVTMDTVDDFIAVLQAMKELGSDHSNPSR